MVFRPIGLLESWKPASYYLSLAKRSAVAVKTSTTVTRSDGCAQYHVFEFQSSADLINAQKAKLLQRQVLPLKLSVSLSEALEQPAVVEAAVEDALHERRRAQMRALYDSDKKAERSAVQGSRRTAADWPKQSPDAAAAAAPARVRAAMAVTSYGCTSPHESERLRAAKTHMALALAPPAHTPTPARWPQPQPASLTAKEGGQAFPDVGSEWGGAGWLAPCA